MEHKLISTLEPIAASIRLLLSILLAVFLLFLVYASISANMSNGQNVSPTNDAKSGPASMIKSHISWGQRMVQPDEILVGRPVKTIILRLEQNDEPDPVEAGKTLVYHITYSNTGYAAATGVFITDTFDANVTPFTSTRPFSITSSLRWAWNIGQVKARSGGTIVVTVTVNSPLTGSLTVFNRVEMSSIGLQTITDEEPTQVIAVPKLSIVKIGQPNPVEPGGTLIYTITYSNTGTAPATNVVVSDEFDSNVTFSAHTCEPRPDDVDESWASWKPGKLKVGERKTIVCSVVVTSTAPSYSILRNVGWIQSDQGDAAPAAISTTVKQTACLRISPGSEVVISPFQAIGHVVTFTHIITNCCGNGPDIITVTVTSTMPSWLTPTLSSFTMTIQAGSSKLTVITATILRVPEESEPPGYLMVKAVSGVDNSVIAQARDQVEVRLFRVFLPLILRIDPEFCNGNFQTGDLTCWVKYEDANFPVVVTRSADSGYNCFDTHAVRIGKSGEVPDGQVPIGRFGIAQTVVVSDIPSPTLRFDYCMYSYDVMQPSDKIYDIFAVAINISPTYTWRVGNPGPGFGYPWASDPAHKLIHQSIDLSGYRGKAVTLYFLVWNQVYPEWNTWAYIDNIDGDFKFKR